MSTTEQNQGTLNQYTIEAYTERDRIPILTVWETSVRATHGFLDPDDFEAIKEMVHQINFNEFNVYTFKEGSETLGFIGVADRKIEMLFFSPEHIGQGYGKHMIDFAINTLKADKVDVNEHNDDALKFYQKCGFEAYERSDTDDQGRPYPIVRMKLASPQ